MMINQQTPVPPERVRVSILEKLFPSLSFALAAVGGAAGAITIQSVFRALRVAETAGAAAIIGGMAEVNLVMAVFLGLAALVGVIGIVVAAARMFTENRTSSPSGVFYLVPAGLSLVPPLLTGYAASLPVSAVRIPPSGGISALADTIGVLCWAAIGTSILALLLLAVYTFVPFGSRTGRKFTPLVFLLLIEGAVAAFAVAFLFELRMCWSLVEMY